MSGVASSPRHRRPVIPAPSRESFASRRMLSESSTTRLGSVDHTVPVFLSDRDRTSIHFPTSGCYGKILSVIFELCPLVTTSDKSSKMPTGRGQVWASSDQNNIPPSSFIPLQKPGISILSRGARDSQRLLSEIADDAGMMDVVVLGGGPLVSSTVNPYMRDRDITPQHLFVLPPPRPGRAIWAFLTPSGVSTSRIKSL